MKSSKEAPIGLRDAWLSIFLCEYVKTKKICVNAWNDFHAWCVKRSTYLREFVKMKIKAHACVKWPFPFLCAFAWNPYFPISVWMRENKKKFAWLRDRVREHKVPLAVKGGGGSIKSVQCHKGSTKTLKQDDNWQLMPVSKGSNS